ncbi:MAG: hypothetical protein KIT84_40910 [Labilithrix sp.]|nr:hypothetical protein [Labilithrix sp.]MCW5817431.1 hypothetical protein [Labilithrix sp.]
MGRRALLLVVAFLVAACSGESGGSGSVSVRVSGEGAAKGGYPYVKDGVEIRFVDGWSVRFSKYLVSVGQLRLAGADDAVAFDSNDVFVVDLHQGDPVIFTASGLDARRWERLSFRVIAPPAEAKPIGAVAADDLARMQREGLNYWLEGVAEKEGRAVAFAWGLANPTRATNCSNGVDGTEGIVVRNNATAEAEITFHLDHLFWDTLGTEIAKLRFDAIAAAAGEDGVVRFDDLTKQALSDLRDGAGEPLRDGAGARLVYNPGSVPLADQTLRAFMLAASAGQAHLNGLGLCTITRL